MIFYLSNSLGNTRQGGSSLSGLHFLKMLEAHYPEQVIVFSDSAHNSLSKVFRYHFIPTENFLSRFSVRDMLKWVVKAASNLVLCRSHYVYDCRGEDVIVFVNSFSNIPSHISFRNYNAIKFVCVVRGDVDSFPSQTSERYNRDWAISFLNQMDCLIYVSKGVKKNWEALLKKRGYYLPNSVKEVSIFPRETSPYSPDKFNIVMVGSIQRRKGQWRLLELCKRIDPTRISIHLIGGCSSTEQDSHSLLNQLCEIEGLHYHGHQSDVTKFIQFADIGLMLSDSEAFPRAVAEYLFFSKPVLTTDVSGATEMVEHGLNGYIVTRSSDKFYEELAGHIDYLSMHPDLCCRFGRQSGEIYRSKYSAEKQYSALRDILQNV
jgi:glycosyltransferase involved in cell wall biosynthesis